MARRAVMELPPEKTPAWMETFRPTDKKTTPARALFTAEVWTCPVCGKGNRASLCEGRIISRFSQRAAPKSPIFFESDTRLHEVACRFPKEFREDEGYIHAFQVHSAYASRLNEGGLFL